MVTEAKRAYMKQWKTANKERVMAYDEAYRSANAERIAANRSANHAAKRVEKNAQAKAWKEKNKEAIREYNAKYTVDRYNTDPLFKLKLIERTRIRQGLRRGEKAGPSTHLLGCSWEFFKHFIEFQFKDGMTWENMGEWHIDHIKPLASFDLSDQAQQMQAFHFSNHQPLWAIDNLKKGAKSA